MLAQPCQSVPFLSKTSIYTHFLCHYVTLFVTISVTLLYIIGVGKLNNRSRGVLLILIHV